MESKMNEKKLPTYKQGVKNEARSKALEHAVTLLTQKRHIAAIAPINYVRSVRDKCSELTYDSRYLEAAKICSDEDIISWEGFRQSVIGNLEAKDITIAYLAGPEPTNDIQTLIKLGVRPENIWAFESSNGEFQQAIQDVKNSKVRGIKLIKMKMEDYFSATPRRFDIIYFDACATFPSRRQKTLQVISTIFKNSSLNSLGVLITNFSSPDITNDTDLENYSQLIANYLYSKDTLDIKKGEHFYAGDSADSNGYYLSRETMPPDEDEEPYFIDEVKKNFDFYYGSFITRHILDIGSIISPIARLASSKLWDNMFIAPSTIISETKKWLTPSPDINDDFSHDYIYEGGNYSLLRTLSYMGVSTNFENHSENVKEFFKNWLKQIGDGNGNFNKGLENIYSFYGCKTNLDYWKDGMHDVKKFNYRGSMPRLCDVPTEELGFYPIFAQFSYPMHCNVREARRYTYIAEGKKNRMFLDVLPFDECRYIYDWLSSGHLVANDLKKISTQLTFRFALDALVKNIHNYQSDFLYGAHAIPFSTHFESAELPERIDLSK